jgi:HNH endonuclease
VSTLYRRTLASPRWRALKLRRAVLVGFRCERCPYRESPNNLARGFELHHRHYLTVGEERLEDVELLCRSCHGPDA